jgi:ribulose bisphosphate carboxylase small subunit
MERASPLINLALIHSTACQELLDEGELNDAIRYCIAQGIEPPFQLCDKRAPDYAYWLERATTSFCDYGWWEKRLKLYHARLAAMPSGHF